MKRILLVVILLGGILVSYNGSSQSLGEYQSNVAAGNWNAAGSWQVWTGVWSAAATPPTGNEPKITILAGHNITMPAAGNPTFTITSQLDIQASGQLTVLTTVVPPLTKLTLTGTINNFGTILISGPGINQIGIAVNGGIIVNSGTITSVAQKLRFNALSTYEHNFTASAGTIPNATWALTSTCLITASNNSTPLGLSQNFGNFRWNYTTQLSAIDLGGALTQIQGDLVLSSNNFAPTTLNGTSNPYTLTIGGSLYCYEYFEINSGSQVTTVNISGNLETDDPLSISSSYLALSSGTGSTVVNISGDLNIFDNGGSGYSAIDMSLFNSGSSTINLMGNLTTQTTLGISVITSGYGSGTYNLNFVGANQSVNSQFPIDGTVNVNVNTGSILSIAAGNFLGTGGNLIVQSGATIRLASTNVNGAIQNGTSGGGLRISGTSTYSSGSTVEYNGSSAQFIGNGHPSDLGVNTNINNSSGDVTLVDDVTIGGDLVLTLGNIVVSSNELTLNGDFTPNSNSINVASTSSISIGGNGAFGTLVTTGSSTINNFTVNRLSGGTVTLGTALTIAGTITQTIGDIILNGQTLIISGPYVRTNGSFNVDASSSFIVNGSGALPAAVTFTGTQALNTLTINRALSTFPTNSTLTVTNLNLLSGTFNNTGTITISAGGVITRTEGSIINNTPQAATTYDIIYNIANDISTGAEVPTLSTQLGSVTKTGGAALTLSQNLTINGNLTLTNGSLNSSTFAIDLKGNLIANSTSVLTSGTFTFSGPNSSISGGAIVRFGALTITGTLSPSIDIRVDGAFTNSGTFTAGSSTVQFGGTSTILGTSQSTFNNVLITGTLTAPTGNFNVAGNWVDNGTFVRGTVTNSVTFSGNTTISGTSTTDFSGVIISGTLNGPSSLHVAGNFTNNGTFSAASGTVLFNGTSLQLIQGTTVTNFNDVTITNVGGPPGVRVATNQDISGVLTLGANVTFDPDGASGTTVFRLRSSADNPADDASIASIPSGASVTGAVTVQRYMSAEVGTSITTGTYRYISSPVSGLNVDDWQNSFTVSGNFTGSDNGSGTIPSGATASLFKYNEALPGDLDQGWEVWPIDGGNSTTASIDQGVGYSAFIRNELGQVTINNVGPIHSGSISLPVSFNADSGAANDGWNLIGNPYPSAIDWDLLHAASTGVSSTIAIRDYASGVYAYYTASGSGTNGGTKNIALGQAFWVHATTASGLALPLTESMKTAGGTYSFFREEGPLNQLRIALRDGTYQDETLIQFHEDAVGGIDHHDAYKLQNVIFNLSSIAADGTDLAINGVGSSICDVEVPLKISNINEGNYTLDFTELSTFNEPVSIYFRDNFTGIYEAITEGYQYPFAVTSDPTSLGDSRFVVSFGKPDLNIDMDVEGSNICEFSTSTLTIANSEPGIFYSALYNGIGISDTIVGTGGDIVLPIDSLLSFGNYEFPIIATNGCTSAQLLKKGVIDVEESATIDQAIGDQSCEGGAMLLQASGAPVNGAYRWYDASDSDVPLAETLLGEFNTPEITETQNFYVSAVNELGCESERVAIEASVVNLEMPLITLDTLEQHGVYQLNSSYQSGNQWFLNNVAIPGATSNTFIMTEPGIYSVMVESNGCIVESNDHNYEDLITGIETDISDAIVSIAPNPFRTSFELSISNDGFNLSETQITIFDISGRIVYVNNKLNSENILINLHDFENGIYLINIYDGETAVQRKLVKE